MTMPTPSEPTPSEPTGLDYQAAYQACYPGSFTQGVRIEDIGDTQLRLVDRVARQIAATRIAAFQQGWAEAEAPYIKPRQETSR